MGELFKLIVVIPPTTKSVIVMLELTGVSHVPRSSPRAGSSSWMFGVKVLTMLLPMPSDRPAHRAAARSPDRDGCRFFAVQPSRAGRPDLGLRRGARRGRAQRCRC